MSIFILLIVSSLLIYSNVLVNLMKIKSPFPYNDFILLSTPFCHWHHSRILSFTCYVLKAWIKHTHTILLNDKYDTKWINILDVSKLIIIYILVMRTTWSNWRMREPPHVSIQWWHKEYESVHKKRALEKHGDTWLPVNHDLVRLK